MSTLSDARDRAYASTRPASDGLSVLGAGATAPEPDPSASDPGDRSTEPTRHRDRRGAWWVLAILLLVTGAVVLLSPVLGAPLNADQRFMYLEATAQTDGTWTRMFDVPLGQVGMRLNQGRFAPLAYLVQFISYTGVTELSIATGLPIAISQALQKLVLLALCLVAVLAFARSLRGRAASGELLALSRRTVRLIGAATVLLTAVGTQAQLQPRNGWTTYAVLTYGAVIVGFGVCAIVLRLTQRLAQRPSIPWIVLSVVVMAVIGFCLNSSYELYYVAYPMALLAVLVQPVAGSGLRRQAWLARAVVGGALSVSFIGVFLAVRVAVAAACADRNACYIGVQPRLGAGIFETWYYNFISSLPGTGLSHDSTEVADHGLGGLPAAFSSALGVFAVLAAVGLVLVRLLVGRPGGARTGAGPIPTGAEELPGGRRGLTVALLQGAGLSLCLAVGSAAVMSVSAQAQDKIQGIGQVYRHTAVAWIAIAVVIALLFVALDLWLPGPAGSALWGGVAVACAVLGAALLPANLAVTRAENIDVGNQAVAAIYREVILPDPTPEGDQRRCATQLQVRRSMRGDGSATRRLLAGAELTYLQHYGVPFCTNPAPIRKPR
jgi:hypothetical protein